MGCGLDALWKQMGLHLRRGCLGQGTVGSDVTLFFAQLAFVVRPQPPFSGSALSVVLFPAALSLPRYSVYGLPCGVNDCVTRQSVAVMFSNHVMWFCWMCGGRKCSSGIPPLWRHIIPPVTCCQTEEALVTNNNVCLLALRRAP